MKVQTLYKMQDFTVQPILWILLTSLRNFLKSMLANWTGIDASFKMGRLFQRRLMFKCQ